MRRMVRTGLPGVGVLVVTGLAVLQRLDAALAAMHPPGDPSVTATGLASWTVLRSTEQKLDGVKAWREWDEGRTGWSSGDTLTAYIVVDIIAVALALSLVLLAAYWAACARAQELQKAASQAASAPNKGTVDTHTAAISRLLRYVPWTILAYFIADVAEDFLLLMAVKTLGLGWLRAAGAASIFKWLALAAAIGPLVLVMVGSALAREHTHDAVSKRVGTLVDELVALRAQALVVAMLVVVCFLPGEVGRQVDDAMLLLIGQPGKATVMVILAVLLSALLWASGRWCLRAYAAAPGQANGTAPQQEQQQHHDHFPAPMSGWLLGTLGLTGLLLLSAGLWGAIKDNAFVAFCVPGGALVIFTGFSLPVRPVHAREWGTVNPPERLLWWLSAAPALLLGLIAVRSGALVIVTGAIGSALWFLIPGIVGLLLGVLWACVRPVPSTGYLKERMERAAWVGNRIAILLGAIMLVTAGLGAANPIGVGEALGAWGVILIFAGVLLVFATVLVVAGDKIPARGALAVVGLRRPPLLAGAIVSVLVTSLVDTSWTYHDVRLPERRTESVHGMTVNLATALSQWRNQVATPTPAPRVQPMVFVAASGGGIRAAYWTSAVLSCLLSGSPGLEEDAEVATATAPEIDTTRDPVVRQHHCDTRAVPRPETIFLASGISGGSLGLAVTRGLNDDPRAYTRVLGEDFLGAAVAGLAFRDAPSSVLRTDSWDDRAAILERAWIKAAAGNNGNLDCGYLHAAQATQGGVCSQPPKLDGSPLRFPLLLFNGVAVDGCRLTASVLDLAPPPRSEITRRAASEDGRNCRSFGGLTTSLDRSGWTAPAQETLPVLSATRDVIDYSCKADKRNLQDPPDPQDPQDPRNPQDLRLATAALISARFPWVSPTGALVNCLDAGHRIYDLDGGILEASGTSPINDMWPAIAQTLEQWNQPAASTGGRPPRPPRVCISPRLILVDNGYVTLTRPGPVGRPLEARAPVDATAAAHGTRPDAARQAIALAFERAFNRVTCQQRHAMQAPRIAHFYPISHPGPQAPLGWSLSRFSRDDLRKELANRHNICQIDIVRSWFTDPSSSQQHCWQTTPSTAEPTK